MSPAPGESHFRLATPMSYTTLASSATIIQFEAPPPANQPTARPTFVQASEAWLDRWHEDCRLTQSDKNLCTRVCRYFNRAHFERTGELLAWPGWATLMAKTGLCKSSVFRGLRKLEQLGALKILHGGHDAKTGWKLPNQYRATPLSPGVILQPGQVANCDQTRLQEETRLAEVGLVEKERIKSFGNSRGPAAPEERKQATRLLPSDSPLSDQAKRRLAEGKSEFTGIPKKTPLNGRRAT
jgi:hypothetical protein